MGSEFARIAVEALYLVLLVSAPVLGASLLVGFLVGLVQTATQIQEQSLSTVPRLVAVGLSLAVAGGWIGAQLLRFTEGVWLAIPTLVP